MKKIIIAILAFSSIIVATPALAAGSCGSVPWIEQATGIANGLIIPCECLESQQGKNVNECGLNALFQTIVNFSQVLLALTGSAALLMFVYGGTMMVVAGTGGGKDNMDKGKNAIIAAVVGIVIVLSAWMIVNVTIIALTGGDIDSPAKIFGNKQFNSRPSGSN